MGEAKEEPVLPPTKGVNKKLKAIVNLENNSE